MKPQSRQASSSLQQAAAVFAAAVNAPEAQTYLASRGISEHTAHRQQLGYVAPGTNTPPGFERFTGRLAIPNLCATGKVVGIKFRAITDTDNAGKYDQLAGAETRLFNLNALNRAGNVLALCEGEFDTLTLEELGIPAVGIPGANSWKPHYWRCLEGVERVVMFVDQDDPGRALLKKVQADLEVVPLAPPSGFHDVNDAVLAGHGDRIRELVFGKEES